MTRQEHLLSILAEECAEVAQRVSKALRFGPTECEPGQPYSNADRIMHEVADLVAAVEMLIEDGTLVDAEEDEIRIARKKEKVEKFLAYSSACGTLECPRKDSDV